MADHADRQVRWESRSIETRPEGRVEIRTGQHKDTFAEVREERPAPEGYTGPDLGYVGRAAGDDARWESVLARKAEKQAMAEPEPLPDITREFHDYADQVLRESKGRKVFSMPALPWKEK